MSERVPIGGWPNPYSESSLAMIRAFGGNAEAERLLDEIDRRWQNRARGTSRTNRSENPVSDSPINDKLSDMTLSKAYTTAWKDLKAFGTKAVSWIEKQEPTVQKVVDEVSAAVEVVAPALTPLVSTFDSLEETVIGELAALASDTANATTLSGLFKDAWPAVQSLVNTLKTHPAVVAASAPSNS